MIDTVCVGVRVVPNRAIMFVVCVFEPPQERTLKTYSHLLF